MRKGIFVCFSGLLFASLLVGCRSEGDGKVVVCDTDAAVELRLTASEVCEELVLTPGPLKAPEHVEIPGDGSLYFRSADTLFRHSLRDGSLERTYGRRGRAKDEYVRLWEYWMDGEDLCLYDFDGRKILRYTRDGTLLGVTELTDSEHPFQLLCRLDPDHLIGRMTYQGLRNVTPELGIFDNDYAYSHAMGDRKLLSGMRTGYPFCRNEEGVLMCAPLSDQILQIGINGSRVKYRVEFSDGSVKLDNYADEFALLNDIAEQLGERSFSYSVSGICERGGYLGFRYLSSKRGAMYALYDRQNEHTYCFNIVLPENWQLCDAVLLDDRVCFVGFGDDAGTCLWTVKTETLLSMGGGGCSCTAADSGGEGAEAYRIVPLRSTTPAEELEPYISDLEVIPVGSDGAARPGIAKILFSDPIVFLAGGAVFSASADWQEITKFGAAGRGPGEYLSVKDIAVNVAGDELWCLDVLNSVLRYDLKSRSYLGKIELGKETYARAMIPGDDNTVALYVPNPADDFPKRNETFYCLSYYDSLGRRTDRKLPWTRFNVMAGFSNPVSAAGPDKLILSPESSDVAYVLHGGEIESRIHFDFGNKWPAPRFFDPRGGDPAKKVGELFEMDCYKLISSVFLPGEMMYFHAYGKESSSWNFLLSKDRSRGIRWQSAGGLTPPISAVASEGGYLYFPYDDYGLVEEEQDPLKKYVVGHLGLPEKTGATFLIKVKFHVD